MKRKKHLKGSVVLGIDADTNKIDIVAGSYHTGEILDMISFTRKDRYVGGLYQMIKELDDWFSPVCKSAGKIKLEKVIMVGIEDYSHHAKNVINSIKKGEMLGLLKFYFFMRDVPMMFTGSVKTSKGRTYKSLYMLSPSRLRKYIPVKSTKGKSNNSFLWIYKKFGIEFTDDDLADAYIIMRIVRNLMYVENKQMCPDKLTKKQKEVIKDLARERQNEGFGNYCLYGMRKKDGNSTERIVL